MITSVTEQAMQVEVEKIILFLESQERLSYLLTRLGHTNLNKNYMYIRYEV